MQATSNRANATCSLETAELPIEEILCFLTNHCCGIDAQLWGRGQILSAPHSTSPTYNISNLCRSLIGLALSSDFLPQHLTMEVPEHQPESFEATSDTLLDALRKVYWDAAEREIRHALLFYNDLCGIFPEATAFEDDIAPFKAANFEKIFNIWSA